MITLIWYPKCSTCKNAKKWLDEHQISYVERHMVEENPTVEELASWFRNNNYPLKQYFNTSGNLYKELHLKEKLPTMSEREQLELLSTNGMLVKRPLVVTDKGILIGFKETVWNEFFK